MQVQFIQLVEFSLLTKWFWVSTMRTMHHVQCAYHTVSSTINMLACCTRHLLCLQHKLCTALLARGVLIHFWLSSEAGHTRSHHGSVLRCRVLTAVNLVRTS